MAGTDSGVGSSGVPNIAALLAGVGGRSVDLLAPEYALNNALFNVKDYGAVGDGVADDTAAFLAAVAASGDYGRTHAPAGDYKLTAVVTLGRFQSMTGDGPSSVLWIHHNGDGVLFSAAAAPAIEARHPSITKLRFRNGAGFTPAAFVANASVANLLIGEVTFNHISGCVYCIDNRQGYGTRVVGCVFNVVTATAAIRFRQNVAGTEWTTIPMVAECDLTSITGNGIVHDGASGGIRDTIIESCSGDGLTLCNVAGIGAAGTPMMITLDNVYFEDNTGYAIRDINSESMLWVKATGCIFYAGAGPSKTDCNGRYIFENCVGNPGNTMTGGGTVRLRNTNAIASTFDGAGGMRLFVEDHSRFWGVWSGIVTPQTFQRGINVNGGLGGGAALILCSADTVGSAVGNDTVAELFLVRYGGDANNYTVASVMRIAGGAAVVEFVFAVDANGFLTVVLNPATGNAKYTVIAQIENGPRDSTPNA